MQHFAHVAIVCQIIRILFITAIGNDFHTSVYDKRDDFGFPIVNFPWLSGSLSLNPIVQCLHCAVG